MQPKTRNSPSELRTGLLFLAPSLIGFLIFTSIPILISFLLSFFKCDLLQTKDILSWQFVGLENFINLLGLHWENNALKANDPEFWRFLGNTIFLMLKVPFTIAISLGLALALNRRIKGIILFRTVYFLPTICIGTALYMLWRWTFNADFGLFNLVLTKLSYGTINGPKWLADPNWAKPAFIIMNIWTEMGGINLILYLAALQTIPQELYEAAAIDGAGRWQKFWHITWPMLGPVTFFILIMNLINGFQGFFQQAHIMTHGGPAGATTTLSYYIYHLAYVWNHMGYAAAVSWILFVVILVITAISWKFGGKTVHYR